MKKFLFFSTIIAIALFAFVLLKAGIKETFVVASTLSSWQLLFIFFLFLFAFFLGTKRLGIILKTKNHSLDFASLFFAKSIGYAFSYITPFAKIGGEPMKAYFLKKEKNIPHSDGLSSVITDKIIDITSGLFLVILGIFYLLFNYAIPNETIYQIMIPVAFFILLLYFFYFKTMRREGFLTALFKRTGIEKLRIIKKHRFNIIAIESGISHFFVENKKESSLAFFLSLLEQTIFIFIFFLLVNFFGFKISIMQSLLIFTFWALSSIFPLPAALGVREGFEAFLFYTLGMNASIGVATILVIRMIELLFVALGILIFSFFGLKSKRN